MPPLSNSFWSYRASGSFTWPVHLWTHATTTGLARKRDVSTRTRSYGATFLEAFYSFCLTVLVPIISWWRGRRTSTIVSSRWEDPLHWVQDLISTCAQQIMDVQQTKINATENLIATLINTQAYRPGFGPPSPNSPSESRMFSNTRDSTISRNNINNVAGNLNFYSYSWQYHLWPVLALLTLILLLVILHYALRLLGKPSIIWEWFGLFPLLLLQFQHSGMLSYEFQAQLEWTFDPTSGVDWLPTEGMPWPGCREPSTFMANESNSFAVPSSAMYA